MAIRVDFNNVRADGMILAYIGNFSDYPIGSTVTVYDPGEPGIFPAVIVDKVFHTRTVILNVDWKNKVN